MQSKLIISAGMPRSGSTWLYNAIRLALSCSQTIKNDLSCGWVGDWKDIPKKGHTVIKVHDYDQSIVDGAEFIVYSYRDIRDAMASSARKFGTAQSMNYVDHLVAMHDKWAAVADLVVAYESILGHKDDVIEKLIRLFNVPNANASAIIEEIDHMAYESGGAKNEIYHSTNLFHRNHITDGRIGSWVGYLDPAFVEQIEIRHRGWFAKRGYPVSN